MGSQSLRNPRSVKLMKFVRLVIGWALCTVGDSLEQLVDKHTVAFYLVTCKIVGTQFGWPGVTLQRSWRRRAKRGTGWNCIMRYHEYTVSADYVLHRSGLWPQQAQRRSSNFLCWPRKLCQDKEGQRGMEWCDDLLEHKPSVWFAVYTTEEVWGWSKVWPGGLIVAWLGSQAQHHRWRLEAAYFLWKTPTSISRRHSGAHTALPKSGTWWWHLCGHINEVVLGLAGPVATSVTCMWKAVKLWRAAAINLSQPVAWLDSCNALPRAWSVQLVPRWNTWPGTGAWDCFGAYCLRMAWQGLAASCITLLAQHMPVGGSHRTGLRKSKDAKKKRKSHIISEEGQNADEETQIFLWRSLGRFHQQGSGDRRNPGLHQPVTTATSAWGSTRRGRASGGSGSTAPADQRRWRWRSRPNRHLTADASSWNPFKDPLGTRSTGY